MTIRGHIEHGNVVLDDQVELPEGIALRIDVDFPSPTDEKKRRTILEVIANLPGGNKTKAQIDQQIREERDSWNDRR